MRFKGRRVERLEESGEPLVERWRDQAAVESHHNAGHMSTFRSAVKGAVAAPPRSTRAEDDSEA